MNQDYHDYKNLGNTYKTDIHIYSPCEIIDIHMNSYAQTIPTDAKNVHHGTAKRSAAMPLTKATPAVAP